MTPATFPRLAEPNSRAFSSTAESNSYVADAFALFYEVASRLSDESGTDVGFRDDTVLWLAFTAVEADILRAGSVDNWMDGDQARGVEPRLADGVMGARSGRLLQVLADPFCRALIQVAQSCGVTVREGEVTSVERRGGRVVGVRLKSGEVLSAGSVVLATGPWTTRLESMLGLPPTVYPVRGQIVVLRETQTVRNRSTSSRLATSILHAPPGGQEFHVIPKADGTILAGGTKEHDAGFDLSTTAEAQEQILAAAIRMVPSLTDAEVVSRLAGLRPGSRDGEPLVVEVPNWPGLFLLTGHYHFGVGPSLLHARIMHDMIAGKPTPEYARVWSPARLINTTP